MMGTKMKKQKEVRKTVISAFISFECLDKLEFLCELYQKSRSQMIEICINTIYAMCVKEGVENMKKEVEE
jgi:hypothetical protein